MPGHSLAPTSHPRTEQEQAMTNTAPLADPYVYTCSICSEPSRDICVYCTKDACPNHRCEKCRRCSDCCECEATYQ